MNHCKHLTGRIIPKYSRNKKPTYKRSCCNSVYIPSIRDYTPSWKRVVNSQ